MRQHCEHVAQLARLHSGSGTAGNGGEAMSEHQAGPELDRLIAEKVMQHAGRRRASVLGIIRAPDCPIDQHRPRFRGVEHLEKSADCWWLDLL